MYQLDGGRGTECGSPWISIIAACLHAARNLQRCIDSVTGQTYRKRELIIIDGGSTDSTVEILKVNADKITYWESEPDRGIYHAWNKALVHAKGEWVCFLGADDYFWSHDVLERIAPHLKMAVPQVHVVYGQVALVDERGLVLEMLGQPWARVRRRFLQEMVIPHQGVFHHRDLFIQDRFDESFRIAGDYDLLLRELRHRQAVFVENVVVAGMQLGGCSSKPVYTMDILREFVRARRKHHVSNLPYHLMWTWLKAVVRRALIVMIGDWRSRKMADLYRRLTRRPQIWTR